MALVWSRSVRLMALITLLSLVLAACGATAPQGSSEPAGEQAPAADPTTAPAGEQAAEPGSDSAASPSGDLVIYSGRSEPLITPVIDLFEERYPDVNVQLKAGKNNELAAALLEERANPQADLFIASDMLIVANLGAEGVFEPYEPAGIEQIPAEYRDPEGTWTSYTLRARVIMYNAELVAPEEVPTSVFELTDPKWQGQVAAAGSTNGSMQAHVAAIAELQGEQAAEEWLTALIDNGTTFFGGHTEVRKAVGAGEFKIGLVNHYYYHLQKAEPSDNNVGVVYPDQGEDQMGVVVNTTAGGIVKGGPNPEAARAFVDFLLTREAQYLFAELNYEYPIIEGVEPAEGVMPLSEFRIAEVSMRSLYDDLDATQALIQRVGLP